MVRKIIGVVLFVGLVVAGRAQEDAPTLSGFRVPEYDEEGNKVSELTGDRAKLGAKGDIEITNLRLEFYKDNKVDTLMTSPKCTYNQQKGVAYSRSNVRMVRESMVVTGKGFAFDRTNELFKIFSEAKVIIKGIKQDADILGAQR